MCALKIVPFCNSRNKEFVAELRREGFAIADLGSQAEVEPFRRAVRREARRFGVRRSFRDQLRVLSSQGEGETRRILARLNRFASPFRLGGEWASSLYVASR